MTLYDWLVNGKKCSEYDLDMHVSWCLRCGTRMDKQEPML